MSGYRRSYKRECQETFFSACLRRRMLSCIQPPAPSNAHTLRLIVLGLAQQQRGSESDSLRFHACDRDDALGFLKLISGGCWIGNHGPIRDSWPIAFWGCPRGHRVIPETRCQSTQSLTDDWILSLEPERLKKSDDTSPGRIPAAGTDSLPRRSNRYLSF